MAGIAPEVTGSDENFDSDVEPTRSAEEMEVSLVIVERDGSQCADVYAHGEAYANEDTTIKSPRRRWPRNRG